MKLSAILSAKSELANEIEDRIEFLNNAIKANNESYVDDHVSSWVSEVNEELSLKIKYYEAILKLIPDLK